jgi:hypothetical protein
MLSAHPYSPSSVFAISPLWHTDITNSGKNVHIGEATCGSAKSGVAGDAPTDFAVLSRNRPPLEFAFPFNHLPRKRVEDGSDDFAPWRHSRHRR